MVLDRVGGVFLTSRNVLRHAGDHLAFDAGLEPPAPQTGLSRLTGSVPDWTSLTRVPT